MQTSNPTTELMTQIEELETVVAFSIAVMECDIDGGSCTTSDGSRTFY